MDWANIRALPKAHRYDTGHLVRADSTWAELVSKNVKTVCIEEPFATHLKHFCHIATVADGTCTDRTPFGQTCSIVGSICVLGNVPVPGHTQLLDYLMSGNVPITDNVRVVCNPLSELFPPVVPGSPPQFNPAYNWCTTLLDSSTVHVGTDKFSLKYALSVLGPGLQLTAIASSALVPFSDPMSLVRSLLRFDAFGIKVQFPDHTTAEYLSTANALVQAHAGTAVEMCAAALCPNISHDTAYYKCAPHLLAAAHGQPQTKFQTEPRLFRGTASEALRLTKGALAFLDIPIEEHADTIRDIIHGLRPSVSKLPPFVAGHLNDDTFLEAMERARTATIHEFFETEPCSTASGTLNVSKIHAISKIVLAVGNYRCRHTAWATLRSAVTSASATATNPLCVVHDEAHFVVHVGGSKDATDITPVPWSIHAPVSISLCVV